MEGAWVLRSLVLPALSEPLDLAHMALALPCALAHPCIDLCQRLLGQNAFRSALADALVSSVLEQREHTIRAIRSTRPFADICLCVEESKNKEALIWACSKLPRCLGVRASDETKKHLGTLYRRTKGILRETMEGVSVLIVYNDLPAGASETDLDVVRSAGEVSRTLQALGVPSRTATMSSVSSLLAAFQSHADLCASSSRAGVVFNMCENADTRTSPRELSRLESAVALVSESLGLGCTGSSAQCALLTLDKAQTKAALRLAGCPVPADVLVTPATTREGFAAQLREAVPAGLVLVKPAAADASEGITCRDSVYDAGTAEGVAGAWARAELLRETMRMDVLVEQLVGTGDLNVSLVDFGPEAGGLRAVAVAEVDMSTRPEGLPRIVDYNSKWAEGSVEWDTCVRHLPARIPAALERRACEVALRAWAATGARDYARVDLRFELDAACEHGGRVWAIEVNGNPDISLDSGFGVSIAHAGVSFADFVACTVRNAARRARRGDPAMTPRRRPSTAPAVDVAVCSREDFAARCSKPHAAAGHALALYLEARGQGEAGVAGAAVGWLAAGEDRDAPGAWVLEWVEVAEQRRKQGVGRALVEHALEMLRGKGARVVAARASEKDRWFLRTCGFDHRGSIENWFAPHEHLALLVRYL
eukprot:m51a1_g11089 putative d-alanine--d-alanine ligase (651) ;mRNA; r:12769-18327